MEGGMRKTKAFILMSHLDQWHTGSGHQEVMHLLQLLLWQHKTVHSFLSRGAWNGDTTHKRGSSLLLLLGLEVTCNISYIVIQNIGFRGKKLDLPWRRRRLGRWQNLTEPLLQAGMRLHVQLLHPVTQKCVNIWVGTTVSWLGQWILCGWRFTLSLSKASLRLCSRAVCSSSCALALTGRETKNVVDVFKKCLNVCTNSDIKLWFWLKNYEMEDRFFFLV